MDTLIAKRTCTDEAGRQLEFSYRLITEQAQYEGTEYEEYGVCVCGPGTQSLRVPSITTDRHRIDELIGLLIRNCVSPVSLPYIIEDWL